MSDSPRLAELLKPGAVIPIDIETTATLCNELSRLHALNAELVEALRDIARQQEGDEESAQAVARAALAKVQT